MYYYIIMIDIKIIDRGITNQVFFQAKVILLF